MKNYPLSLQIWMVFAAITLCISILLTILFPWTLRDFFTREIYATIESAQSLLFGRFDHELTREAWETGQTIDRRQQIQNIRTVNHMIFLDDVQGENISVRLPAEFINQIMREIKDQKQESIRYSGDIDGRKIFYVITKGKGWDNVDVSLISYMWDSYREDLVKTLFKRLILIMVLVFVLSWIPSLSLARYLSKPLVILEKRVEKLANRDWKEPVQLQRKDEIGNLGQSVEQLRRQLILQDEAQQSFLQNVSHELKTPVMIIRSYVQAIRDGIYPKGDLPSTVQVVEEEAERLEKRIHNLLYLTKLDYLATHKLTHGTFHINKMIEDVVGRFTLRRHEIQWKLNLSDIEIEGDTEQWRVVLENLLDNQIRYADKSIVINLAQSKNKGKDTVILHVWNDGPMIEPEVFEMLFDKFKKGYKGEFGLGLTIIKRILAFHGATIWAKNEDGGVSFYIEIPPLEEGN